MSVDSGGRGEGEVENEKNKLESSGEKRRLLFFIHLSTRYILCEYRCATFGHKLDKNSIELQLLLQYTVFVFFLPTFSRLLADRHGFKDGSNAGSAKMETLPPFSLLLPPPLMPEKKIPYLTGYVYNVYIFPITVALLPPSLSPIYRLLTRMHISSQSLPFLES